MQEAEQKNREKFFRFIPHATCHAQRISESSNSIHLRKSYFILFSHFFSLHVLELKRMPQLHNLIPLMGCERYLTNCSIFTLLDCFPFNFIHTALATTMTTTTTTNLTTCAIVHTHACISMQSTNAQTMLTKLWLDVIIRKRNARPREMCVYACAAKQTGVTASSLHITYISR